MNKDLFSNHATAYRAFRPHYPEALYEFVLSLVSSKHHAWDCATGNGQVAHRLADDFHKVSATDISTKQLGEAILKPNITYSVSAAEQTQFPDKIFDLITVAQALHWFNADLFYDEARRVGKVNSVLAVWGYGNIVTNNVIDPVIQNFYKNVVGPYWDEARRHVEDGYRTLPFPVASLKTPSFTIDLHWNPDQITGYLRSWSATQKYIETTGTDPIPDVVKELRNRGLVHSEPVSVHFPIFLKVGKIQG